MPLPFPDAALDGDIIIPAKKGAGKTVTSKVIIEELLRQGERVIIIDPLSVHWGLKSGADGKSEGFPIAIFGGPRADVKISLSAAKPLAETLVKNNLPAIIDVSDWLEEDQSVFLIPFLSEIFQSNKSPVWLVLEEAHEFAPQVSNSREQQALLAMVRRISKGGRSKGIRLIAITQRTAELHKSLISGASTIIAMKTTATLDQAPVIKWFESNSDKPFAADVKKNIAKLKIGEAFIGASDQDFFERVKFPMNKTFDSSATPKRGETRIEPTRLSKIDLKGIKEAFASDQEEEKAQEDDKSVSKRSPALDAATIEKAKREAREEALRGVEASIEAARNEGALTGWKMAFEAMDGVRTPPSAFKSVEVTQSIKIETSAPVLSKSIPKPLPSEAEGLTGPQTRVLKGLAFWENLGFPEPMRTQVAFVANYSVKSSSFEKAYGSLRTAGWVSYPSGKTLKAEKDVSGFLQETISVSSLTARLTGPQRRALIPMLVGGYLDRADIAEQADYSPKSSSFEKALGGLRSLGLIDYGPNHTAAASDWLVQLHRMS